MSLKEYTRKRNFGETAEPKAAREKQTAHRFVIQKHAASRLHYDFRLEINGVLKSWAVPKGVPFIKGEKRLAVQVEDHPVSYINFEGTIPKGQYGGGTVMVWDEGTFSTDDKSSLWELSNGKLHFTLDGQKLHGDWYLVQLRDSKQWLLIKGGEDLKPISKKLDDTSALSGKTMAQLSENGAVWQSKPCDSTSSKQNSFKERLRAKVSKPKSLPVKFIPPMKAKLVKLPPSGDEREIEIKFDGYWARAFKNGGDVQLLSRNEKDFSQKFPQIVEAVHELKIRQAELEGEIVALNEKGISKFQLLQAYELGEKRPPLFFYAFDLLRLNGKDLTRLPLVERKAQLKKILGNQSGLIRYSASLGDDAKRLLKLAKKTGLEGLVCKRKDSLYEAGERSGAWVKLKFHKEQEFVIGGFTNHHRRGQRHRTFRRHSVCQGRRGHLYRLPQ
ncbi:MAG TPA: DNA polymerase ligase N-terminal domain-containing protein [Verrucomicrobiae bacterium]|jgi:bifunctional non-homologous end joining protein LigD|nr:DNA polymerase ligase N-terminal domain-containing protein [Verrucomicrobiae bacterium]